MTAEEFTRLESEAVDRTLFYTRIEAQQYAEEQDLDAATLAILWQALELEAIRQGIPMSVLIGVHDEL